MLKVVGKGNVSWWFKVPVPLLFCSDCGGALPAVNPGEFTAEGMA
jgi:hypothetical protein